MSRYSEAKTILDELYDYDKFSFPPTIEEKREKIAKKINLIRKKLGPEEPSDRNRLADYTYIIGKAYNVLETYQPFAHRNLMRAVKLAPNNVDAWMALALSHQKSGSVRRSLVALERALQLSPTDPAVCRSFAFLFRSPKAFQLLPHASRGPAYEAVNYAKRAVSLAPGDAMNWQCLGFSLAHLSLSGAVIDGSAFSRARTALRKAAAMFAPRPCPDLFFTLGMIERASFRLQAAHDAFATAAEMDPAFVEAREATAEICAVAEAAATQSRFSVRDGEIGPPAPGAQPARVPPVTALQSLCLGQNRAAMQISFTVREFITPDRFVPAIALCAFAFAKREAVLPVIFFERPASVRAGAAVTFKGPTLAVVQLTVAQAFHEFPVLFLARAASQNMLVGGRSPLPGEIVGAVADLTGK